MMKNFIAALVICATLATASFDAEAARRFGGGSNLGRPAPTFFNKSAPATAPKAQTQPSQTQNAAQANRPTPAPQAQKPSMLRSVLTGIAAALGITALLSLLGLGGAGLASVISGILLAIVIFFALRFAMRLFMNKQAAGATANSAPSPASYEAPPARNEMSAESTQAAQQTSSTASANSVPNTYASTGSTPGSVMDKFFGSGANATATTPQEGLSDVTPADFNKEAFLKAAKENFVLLQKAWATGNVIEISEFTTDDLFIEITHELKQRGKEALTCEVQSLEADLMGIAQYEGKYYASVSFNASLLINNEVEMAREIWVLEKPVEGEGGWLLTSINQQNVAES